MKVTQKQQEPEGVMSGEGRVGPRAETRGLSPEALWEEQFQALGSDRIAPPRQE